MSKELRKSAKNFEEPQTDLMATLLRRIYALTA
jgi:hypothetical protein